MTPSPGSPKSPAKFENIALVGGGTAKTEFYKEGTRALELYDSAVDSYFLKTFGRNEREIVCECERSNQPSMVQVLHLSNGDTLNSRLSKKGGIVAGMLASKKTNGKNRRGSLFEMSVTNADRSGKKWISGNIENNPGKGKTNRSGRSVLGADDLAGVFVSAVRVRAKSESKRS